jgi:threonylcarbamoyladenosine tRNA methylthiotransferase MtaB
VRRLVEEGYGEVVLTGVHLGTWGRDLSPPLTLAALLQELVEVPGLARLRLSSIEPTEFTPELITAIASPKICPHLHIPLQSGSTTILRAMGRSYGPETYRETVEKLLDAVPDLGLGADVIAGFPGEREEEFDETRRFLEKLPLYYLHVFPFSKRPGTPAAGLPLQVEGEEKRRRAGDLRRLGREKAAAFRRERLGRVYEALIETQPDRETGLGKALTGNYLKALVEGSEGMGRTLRQIRLTRLEGGNLYGEIVG